MKQISRRQLKRFSKPWITQGIRASIKIIFEKCSGLKVNYKKTEAMWIGSSRNNTETPLALKWRKTAKALGVHFSYNNEESVQKNFYDKLREIKFQIR